MHRSARHRAGRCAGGKRSSASALQPCSRSSSGAFPGLFGWPCTSARAPPQGSPICAGAARRIGTRHDARQDSSSPCGAQRPASGHCCMITSAHLLFGERLRAGKMSPHPSSSAPAAQRSSRHSAAASGRRPPCSAPAGRMQCLGSTLVAGAWLVALLLGVHPPYSRGGGAGGRRTGHGRRQPCVLESRHDDADVGPRKSACGTPGFWCMPELM